MSVDYQRKQIESVNRDLARLHDQLSHERKTESDKFSRINTIERGITKNTSPTMLQSKVREIDRLNGDIARSKKKQAELSKKIADKEKKKHDHEKRLMDEQRREQQNYQKEQERVLSQHRAELHRQLTDAAAAKHKNAPNKEYDVFISHASEDKEHFVTSLAHALQTGGCRVWYDEFELKVGDSLRRKIDQGLANSRYGIVVLSTAFFAKNWPQYELDGLVTKETSSNDKVILPIWHKVSKDEVASYSPTLADKVALNTGFQSLDEIVRELVAVIQPGPEVTTTMTITESVQAFHVPDGKQVTDMNVPNTTDQSDKPPSEHDRKETPP